MEYYHANQMVKPEGNNNMMHPSTVWARGPYPVMVDLGEAWCCPSKADHSLPLLIRLIHCLLRQEGRPLQHHLLCCCSMSVTRLWLWRGAAVFFPDGQVSKSGGESKPKAWEEQGPASETTAPLSHLPFSQYTPPPSTKTERDRLLQAISQLSRLYWGICSK